MVSGFVPRARARRSASSCSGIADPSAALTPRGSTLASGTARRPAGVSGQRHLVAQVRGDDGGGGHAQCRYGTQNLQRALDEEAAERIGIGQDEDEAGLLVGGGQQAMQDRLEVMRGGRQMCALLDLQGELAAVDVIDARACDQQPVAGGQCLRDLGRGRFGVGHLQQGVQRRRVERCAAQDGAQRRGDDERRQVADRVAPALVLLLGGDQDVGQGGAR